MKSFHATVHIRQTLPHTDEPRIAEDGMVAFKKLLEFMEEYKRVNLYV